MKIGIASDHRGVNIKENIKKMLSSYEVKDFGTNSDESVDYPDFAFMVGEAINNKEIDLGILICGTGIGMSIACNKVKNIRCARVTNKEDAYFAKLHNNANVIALGENTNNLNDIIETFICTNFSDELKHHRRVEKINSYEN